MQTGPIGQEYGKYGIIRETDMYSKRPEFQLWAIEVGSIAPCALTPAFYACGLFDCHCAHVIFCSYFS